MPFSALSNQQLLAVAIPIGAVDPALLQELPEDFGMELTTAIKALNSRTWAASTK